ncbi:MAG TPA: helix-turn-helix domain-containing protein [Pseudolabrys sp.]|nr:helix-turn-helix domain-containing protein [Pseudolabrys sp.]
MALAAFASDALPAMLGETFVPALAQRDWVIRQRHRRRAHMLAMTARRGTAAVRGLNLAFAAPTLVWLPADTEAVLQVEAGAAGHLVSVSEDLLTRTMASSPEALHLRRTVDRLVLLDGRQHDGAFSAVVRSCGAIVHELRHPQRGGEALLSSHLLLMCLHLWRATAHEETDDEAPARGDGPRLVGNFLQMVELHYRDGWPVARYAAALGVTGDKLHVHCKREKGRSPLAIIHARLVQEACTRLLQLDLPVEQIGYGLGFRDPAYFSRFFRKYNGVSPGAYRRRERLKERAREPSFAAWP